MIAKVVKNLIFRIKSRNTSGEIGKIIVEEITIIHEGKYVDQKRNFT